MNISCLVKVLCIQRKKLFYTFLYNIKVHYPFVKRDNSNEINCVLFTLKHDH